MNRTATETVSSRDPNDKTAAAIQQVVPGLKRLRKYHQSGLLNFNIDLTPFRNTKHKALIACTSRTGSSLLAKQLTIYGNIGYVAESLKLNPTIANYQAHLQNGGMAFPNLVQSWVHNRLWNFAALLAYPVRFDQSAELDLSNVSDWERFYNGFQRPPFFRQLLMPEDITRLEVEVFVSKGGAYALDLLCAIGELPGYANEWKFVFLRRRNLVRQAISMSIAKKTDAWSSYSVPSQEINADDYNFAEILGNVKVIVVANGRLELLFKLLRIEPLELFYEDYIEDLDAWNSRILTALQLPGDTPANIEIKLGAADMNLLNIQPQNTQINETWEQRFHEDIEGNLGNC